MKAYHPPLPPFPEKSTQEERTEMARLWLVDIISGNPFFLKHMPAGWHLWPYDRLKEKAQEVVRREAAASRRFLLACLGVALISLLLVVFF